MTLHEGKRHSIDDWDLAYALDPNPNFLSAALRECLVSRQVPPEWLVSNIEATLAPLIDKRPSRGERSPAERANNRIVDHLRYKMVKALKSRKVSGREVYQAASDLSRDPRLHRVNPDVAGSDEAFRKSCQREVKRLRTYAKNRRAQMTDILQEAKRLKNLREADPSAYAAFMKQATIRLENACDDSPMTHETRVIMQAMLSDATFTRVG